MTTLYGANGAPISTPNKPITFDPLATRTDDVQGFRKEKPPRTGVAFGDWAGRDTRHLQLPGGGALTFDLSQLTLTDFRQMRWHPQVNISLSILNFMLYQIDWNITAVDKSAKGTEKITAPLEENLRRLWPQMAGAISQAFWAGFAPTVVEWENNPRTKYVEISRFKDLVPEDSVVNWKTVEGWAPPGRTKPKYREYDGIIQLGGSGWPIPANATLWYPLLMENGDYYGRHLLKPAFMPWYFSNLVHLFANRYYERFGEPTPIGRAPYDAEVLREDGTTMTGRQAMEEVMMNLRSRGVVTLPSDRDPTSNLYDYDLTYIESQMRGVDFDRYLGRLDEEISMGMFTPLLLFRSGDVGSNSLGVQHARTFLWMVNGVYSDIKYYIDQHILKRWKSFNFPGSAPDVEWNFRKLGNESQETLRAIIATLIAKDKIEVDLDELGQALGMSVKEVRQMQDDPSKPAGEVGDSGDLNLAEVGGMDLRIRDDKKRGPVTSSNPRGARDVSQSITARLGAQIGNAWKKASFDKEFEPSFGFKRQLIEALHADGVPADDAASRAERFFDRLDAAVTDMAHVGMGGFAGPEEVVEIVKVHVEAALDEAVR